MPRSTHPCIWTLQGWLFLAVILDLFSHRIVGWAMSKNIDEGLILGALRMALLNRNPKPGLIHHSDRGSVYCASDYSAVLQAYGIERSMSRKADCWDNAVAESFFGTLKQELVFRLKLQSCTATRTLIFEYMEGYYNSRRRHSTLGFLSPIDFEGKN